MTKRLSKRFNQLVAFVLIMAMVMPNVAYANVRAMEALEPIASWTGEIAPIAFYDGTLSFESEDYNHQRLNTLSVKGVNNATKKKFDF